MVSDKQRVRGELSRMKNVDTTQNGSHGFDGTRVNARVRESGVILLLGLISITMGRG